MQDAYSLRCAPQVAGAARDTVDHAAAVAGSSSPRRSTTRSSPSTAGSSPTATSTAPRSRYVLDFLAIVAADLASIAERRTDRFLDPSRSNGLPPFLADDPGRRLRPHDRPVHPGGDRLAS